KLSALAFFTEVLASLRLSPNLAITPRPRQRLLRVSAAENDEVVGVVHQMGAERRAASSRPPMLQKAVHVEVGQHRADHAALRRAPPVPLAPDQSPSSLAVPLFDRDTQPQLDQAQHVRVADSSSHALHGSRCGMVSKYLDRSASTTSA